MNTVTLLLGIICSVSSQEESNYQLPRDVIPRHYRLNIRTDLHSSKYRGEAWITIECIQATSFIKLHSKKLVIYDSGNGKVTVVEKGGQSELDISESNNDEENDQYVITLSKPLVDRKMYVVHMNFEGDLDMVGEGFFRVSYEDKTGSTRWYALTDFKTGARNAFPCFDEPYFRAIFSINIGVKRPLIPISNMPLITNRKYSGKNKCHLRLSFQRQYFKYVLQFLSKFKIASSWVFRLFRKETTESDIVWYSFQETQNISPHQVSFVITSLDHCEVTYPWASASLILWAQTDSMEHLQTAVSNPEKTANAILHFVEFYKEFLSTNCPLPEIDLVSLPDSGYISSFGIIIELEGVLLSNAEMREINRLAHSVAKLWLDGLVTFSWWSDLWYSWSLAEHLASLAMDHVYPKWNIVNRVLVSRTESIYSEESKDEEVTTVFMPITSPEEVVGSYYNSIFYDKGPVLIRMVHLFLGDEVFKKGLNAFLLNFQHASATTNDLWASLTKAAHEAKVLANGLELQQIMNNWLTLTGFPIVTVTRDYKTNKITVSQKPFIKDESGVENPHSCWWIPLSYSTTKKLMFSDTNPEHWLNCEKKELTFHIEASDSEWVILNNKMAGLYRVNYDTENWNLIAAALRKPDFSKIDVLNRVQLLTDSWDFTKGDLEYKTAFSIFTYLQFEKDYLPWKVAIARLKDIKEKLYRTTEGHVFENYMQKLLIEVFKKFEDLKEPQDEEEKLEKSFIVKWACEFNVAQCNLRAKELFFNWKNSHKSLPEDIRRTVFCKGVQAGEWEYLEKYYRTIDDSDERKHILFALSCTHDSDLHERYLQWSITEDSPIPPQFCFDAFRKVVKNKVGYKIAWDFFFKNIQRISDHSGRGNDVLAMYVTALAEQVISDEELKKLKDKVEQNKKLLQNIDEELEDAFNDGEKRLRWLKENYSSIITAIRQTQL